MAVTNCGAGKYKLTAEDDVLTGVFYIEWIEWISVSATAGDLLLVSDNEPLDIQAGVADGANYHRLYPIGGTYTNPTLTDLDSGTVYIQTTKNPANF